MLFRVLFGIFGRVIYPAGERIAAAWRWMRATLCRIRGHKTSYIKVYEMDRFDVARGPRYYRACACGRRVAVSYIEYVNNTTELRE